MCLFNFNFLTIKIFRKDANKKQNVDQTLKKRPVTEEKITENE